MPTPDTPQLTLADFATAQGKMPTATWAALSAHQQGFVAALVRTPGLTLTRAAEIATGTKSRAKQNGSQWFRDPKVQAALNAIRKAAEDKAESDLAFVKRRLVENDGVAFGERDIPASNGALGLYAKVTGLTEKRVRISFDNPEAMVAQLKAMPLAERKKVILDMLSE
jgi:hypothetical protein